MEKLLDRPDLVLNLEGKSQFVSTLIKPLADETRQNLQTIK